MRQLVHHGGVRRVQRLLLSRLVSCGVNLKIVVNIRTRFGYKRKKARNISVGDFLRGRKAYPHLFMFQELEDDIPKIFKVHLLLRLGLIRR